MHYNLAEDEDIKMKILEGRKKYKQVLRECRYLIDKGDHEKGRQKKMNYSIAYRLLCNFESQHPMYIRKMSRMRETLTDRLK